METSAEKGNRNSDEFEFFPGICSSTELVTDSSTSSRQSSSDSSADEDKGKECSSPDPFGWPIRKSRVRKCPASEGEKKTHLDDEKVKKMGSEISG